MTLRGVICERKAEAYAWMMWVLPQSKFHHLEKKTLLMSSSKKKWGQHGWLHVSEEVARGIHNPIIIQYFPEHSESQIHGRSTCPAIIDLDVVGVSQQALVFHNHQQVAATTRNGTVCAAQQILALELRGTSRPSGGFILRCRNNLRMPEGCVETLGVVSRTPQIGGLVKISVNCQNGSKWIKMVMVTMEYNGSWFAHKKNVSNWSCFMLLHHVSPACHYGHYGHYGSWPGGSSSAQPRVVIISVCLSGPNAGTYAGRVPKRKAILSHGTRHWKSLELLGSPVECGKSLLIRNQNSIEKWTMNRWTAKDQFGGLFFD